MEKSLTACVHRPLEALERVVGGRGHDEPGHLRRAEKAVVGGGGGGGVRQRGRGRRQGDSLAVRSGGGRGGGRVRVGGA